MLLALGPEGGAGLQEITRGVGGAWAEPGTAAGSCDESVSCKELPARQNFASTPAARHPRVGRGSGRGIGSREHVTLSQLGFQNPRHCWETARSRAASCDTHARAHTHTHRKHRRAEIWSLHLISTPKAGDESDPWKIKIDGSNENKTALKSSPKRNVEEGKEGGSCLCALNYQTSSKILVPTGKARVPRGPLTRQTRRTHRGPRWAAAPEGRLALLLSRVALGEGILD